MLKLLFYPSVSCVLFSVYFTKEECKITNRNQKMMSVELHLNSRQLWFSHSETSTKIPISECTVQLGVQTRSGYLL